MYRAQHKQRPIRRFGGAASYFSMMALCAAFVLLLGVMVFAK